MFRLFIIIAILNITMVGLGQTSTRELKFRAQQNLEQEDYAEASKYFDSIIQRDSSEYKILLNYTDLLIKNKDFIKAEILLKKLNNINNKKISKENIYLQLGLVKKQLGDLQGSLNYFNECLTKIKENANKQLFDKITREIESCEWAILNYKDSADYTIHKIHGLANEDSEFGHAVIGPLLIISSLKCEKCIDSIGFSNDGYTNKLYSMSKENGSQLKEIKPINSSINNTSNGTFSSDKKKFYFSSCNIQPQNKKCKILVSNYKNGIWSSPDTLKGEINTNEYSYTMPAFAKIQGKDYLFFCSDAQKSIGGLDIFYGLLNQNTVKDVKTIEYINSVEEDIAPFYDNNSQTLYFSSSWHNGYGGYDLFKTNFTPNKISKIENLGLPFNSCNNDTYLVKDSLNYFITSNRNHASKNKTCCTDIYQLSPINSKIDSLSYKSNIDSTINLIIAEKTNRTKNNIDKLEQLIPISLYFHNDIPNPKSNDTTTYLNYLETYENYNLLNGTYTIKYTEGLIGDNKINAQKEINDFFALNLQKGKKDLDDFLDIMLEELRKGGKFELIFKGYASPLAKNNYNKFLSKRRINSVKNYIGIYKNGILLNYLISETENRTPAITFKEESYGEYLSNKLVSDNPNDIKNSIYSVKAALERKVEIIGFRIR